MPWDWRGTVAVILAAGIAVSVVSLCMGAVIQDETISNQGAALIETVLGASVGAVATYLGGWAARGNPTVPTIPVEKGEPPPPASSPPNPPS
jgi:hypothetical protein